MPLIQAIDMNNPKGKKRDHLTSISLGFNGDRRSEYQAATVYCKAVELQTKWKRPGKLPDAHHQTHEWRHSYRGQAVPQGAEADWACPASGLDWCGRELAVLRHRRQFDIANSVQTAAH